MNIRYLPYKDENRAELLSLVHGLYTEDLEGEVMTDEKIIATINFLSENRKNGEILIFTEDNNIIGYSILIYNWSNEFGGQIIFIDELYVKNEYRSKNIGSGFIKYLSNKKNEDFKAIFLQVLPANKKAVEFYIRNGFVKNEGTFLKYLL